MTWDSSWIVPVPKDIVVAARNEILSIRDCDVVFDKPGLTVDFKDRAIDGGSEG